MEVFELVVLALIQGLTEFLPISSSAHLILPSQLLGWKDQGLTYDVAVHFGTLIAVMSYYRSTLANMGKDIIQHPGALWPKKTRAHQKLDPQAQPNIQLFKQVLLASVPVLLVGYTCHNWIEQNFRSLWVIAFTTLIFGLLLGYAELSGRKQLSLANLTFPLALVIGLAQTLALIPGTSRSGITIAVALLIGMRSSDSAHFSFLLSIPTILAATILQLVALIQQPEHFILTDLVLAGTISGVSAYLTIAVFIKLLDSIGMMPFVVYRILLACYLFYLII